MLYIRTDMNPVIATGHVMRCLSIADAVRMLGEDVTFLTADRQAAELLTERGYRFIALKTQWDKMESELPVLSGFIEEYKIASVLVDSYQVTETYLSRLSQMTKVLYIDDLNKFHYPVELLICYANYWEKFGYPDRYIHTRLLLGPEYMPLRQGFSGIGARRIKEKAETLLLLAGGFDAYHMIDRILEKISLKDFKQITAVCGRYYERYDDLVKKYEAYPNVRIYRMVEDMTAYMLEADIAVSAGGTTLYELCACGTPAISYAMAENQLDNVNKFAEDGVIDHAGEAGKDETIEHIAALIERYALDRMIRRERSRKMQKLVDGQGAWRIAKEWLKL